MKTLKTVLAFLLVFVLMFGNTAKALAADDNEGGGSDPDPGGAQHHRRRERIRAGHDVLPRSDDRAVCLL